MFNITYTLQISTKFITFPICLYSTLPLPQILILPPTYLADLHESVHLSSVCPSPSLSGQSLSRIHTRIQVAFVLPRCKLQNPPLSSLQLRLQFEIN